MTSLGYLDLLHELIQLDRVRQLANAHRKTGHIPINSKTINAVENVGTNQHTSESRQQPRRSGKGTGRPKRWTCLRCLDTTPPSGHLHRNCPSSSPVEKEGRCHHCNRTIGSGRNCCQDPARCTASTNRRCPRCSAEGKHHPFHCPGPLPAEGSRTVEEKTKSTTTTLTFENVLIAGTSTPMSTSPLRSTTVRVRSGTGSVPITGLIDTGAEMTAISRNTMDTLLQEGAEVPQPKAYCTALMADGKPIPDCPIHDLVFIHGTNQISAPVVVIKDLSKDILVSAHLFRQFTNPTVWLFSSVGDRLFNVGSLNSELKALWEAFYHRLTTSTSTSTDTPQLVDSSADSNIQSESLSLLNTTPYSDEELCTSLSLSSPVIYGITLSEQQDEEQSSSGQNAVSIINTDIDNISDASTTSTPTNRYQHRIKWLKPKPANNVQALRKIAERLEQRLRRDGIFELYDAEIEKFKQKGYIKPVTSTYAKFCLNHFPVVRKHGNELSSMKVRPVFDGSSLRGIVSPNLTDCDKQHVTSSIYLLRRFSYCISCDFQAAFLQVEYETGEKVRAYHQILLLVTVVVVRTAVVDTYT